MVISGNGHHGQRDIVIDVEGDSEREIILEPHQHRHHHYGRRDNGVIIEDINSLGKDYVVEVAPSRQCNKHREAVVEEVRDLEIDLPRRIIDMPQRAIEEEVIVERKRAPCNKKPEVFVHKLAPIVVNAKPRHIVVEAGKPQIIRTPPVFIHRKGQVHHESPRVVHHQSKPIFLTEKILKVSRPIHKKVFVEKFVREESAGHEEVVEKKLCQSSGREIERSNGYVERLDLGDRIRGGVERIEEVDVDRDGSVVLESEDDLLWAPCGYKSPPRVDVL